MEISDEKLKNLLTNKNKNSAKRDTRPLKGRDLTINVHQGKHFFKGSGLSVAPKT